MTPQESSAQAEEICRLSPVVPVLVLNDVVKARPLAEALVDGGLPALEVTLRTPNALDVIRQMAEVDGGVVGAGTLLSPSDVFAAKDAGALFGVTPGTTDRLVDASLEAGLPLLPGAATASEALRLLELGFSVQKFFPAEASGGVAALKAIGAPIPQVRFCPTGGVTLENAPSYLGLENTLCVGGSWVAPNSAIENEDWDQVRRLAQEASRLTA